ncbi:DNA-binding transcriptional regulator [Alcaligenaceae bacterium A4P071]|nr:DNA-binding transcriptional regulator [Alcaligenaceae bacterium A4P071]
MKAKPLQEFKSPAFEAIHSAVSDLREAGRVDDAKMLEFDAMCLQAASPLHPDDIVRMRRAAKVSQAVFAHYLNTRTATVSAWEAGLKQPRGMAAKLLQVVKKHGLEVLV